MNCAEFEERLDQGIPADGAWPAQVKEHLAACAKCRFSLRVEVALQSAPDWSPKFSMASERRVSLLANAAVRRVFRREIQERFVDAAITAVLVGGILAGVLFALPGFVHDWKWPKPVARFLEAIFPWFYHLKQTLVQMAPLLQTGVGKTVFAAMFVVLVFSLILMARVILPSTGRWPPHVPEL